ncbi:hypothetical protein LSAT2_017426, partial [Lamellibrachia satsuma]
MYNHYRDPYNKYGPNRAYDNDMGYTSEPRGRNDNVRRSSKRRGDRRVSSRRATHVPYVQDERNWKGPGRDRDPAFNTGMSERRDDFNNSTTYDDKRGKRPVVVVVVFCLLLLLVLGALALGAVALYYAHIFSDTYFVEMAVDDASVTAKIILPKESAFKKMETKVCEGVKAVFGRELKSCTLDTLQKIGEVLVEGRLRFHRDKLQAAANEAGPDAILDYVKDRLNYACLTELICERKDVTLLPKRGSFKLMSNFSTATPKVGKRNDTNYYAAQKSVCDAIKTQLGSLYSNCYVAKFETDDGRTSIYVDVDNNGLLDEVKKDDVGLKSISTFLSLRKTTLTKLINKDGPKVDFFNGVVLNV